MAGTATLVSPCHVLSAYHVAGGGEAVDAGTRATFYLGEGDDGPGFDDFDHFALEAQARAIVWGNYRPPPSRGDAALPSDRDQQNGWEDWALLKLDTCLGEEKYGYGYMRLKAIATRELFRSGARLEARNLGFPVDRDSAELWMDPECRVIGQIYSSGWQHDCITLPGNSGGPILIRDRDDGGDRIVAINVSHIGMEGIETGQSDRLFLGADDPTFYEYLSIAVPVSAFIGKIVGHLPEDPELSRFAAAPEDEHYAEGAEELAIADLDQALARRPKDMDLMLLRGIWNASKGDIEAALLDLGRAEIAADTGPPARYHRARLMLELGGPETLPEAEDILTELTEGFPRNWDLRHFRGLTRARRENWEGAIADYAEVLKQRPESAIVANDRGDAYRALRDFDRALSDYDQAIALAPDWPEAWRDRGYLEHVLARHHKAMRDFQQALAIDKADAEAMNGIGLIALARGEGAQAMAEFDKAIQALPDSGVYLANRGAAAWVKGDFEGALADFRRSIALDPKEPYIHLFEFLALARLGERSRAIQGLRQYLEDGADDEWPRPLIEYYLGESSVAAVEAGVAAAPEGKRGGYLFDRDFYLGEWALIRGDRTSAQRRLKAVLDSRLREYLEFDLARADLLALGVEVEE